MRPEYLRLKGKFENRETQIHANIAMILEVEFYGAGRNFLMEITHGTLKIRTDAVQFPFDPRDSVVLDFSAQGAWLLP